MYNDDEIRQYKPSGIFSPLGAVMLTITTFIMLSILFIPYLWLVRICPVIIINILLAVFVSVAAGYAGGMITKIFKMRNAKVAIVSVVIAFLGATYVKWAMYDFYDNTVVIKDAMNKSTAYSYYGLDELFPEGEDPEAYIEYYLSTDKWKEYEYDVLLGSSVSEVEDSIKKAKTTGAYTFTYAPGKYEEVTFIHILTHPSYLWDDIKAINEIGRWTLNNDKNNVSGFILWITWIGEFVLLGIVLIFIAANKAKKPFIETDNEWTQEGNFSKRLRFAPCSDNVNELKNMLMTDQNRFFQQLFSDHDKPYTYIGIDLFMSRDRNENYLSAYFYSYVEKNKNYTSKKIVKYAYCDRDLCLYLLNLIGEQ